MKRLSVILLCFLSYASMGQILDITDYSQNIALRDSVNTPLDSTVYIPSAYPSISETYQIPAFNLYHQYWDVNHLRSKVLEIPFSEDRLMMLLVQEGNHNFVFPCIYKEITLAYGQNKKGKFHPGMDLLVDHHAQVKSCFDGVVRMAKSYGDYGLMVVVRHYNGLETVYAHLDKLCVKPGQMVNAGDVIGQAGNSGNVKKSILHFETRFLNEHFNPELMIDFGNEELVKNTLSLSSSDIKPISIDELKGNPATSSVVPPQNGNSEYHIVQKGESLSRIANIYHTSVERILKLNNLDNPDKIAEGQKLRIK